MVQELRQRKALVFRFSGGVHQLLEVLNAVLRGRLAFLFQELEVTGSIQDRFEELTHAQVLTILRQLLHERMEASQGAHGPGGQSFLKQLLLERFP